MLRENELLTIDTRQGTNNQHSYSNGNCLPYTGVPFGMNYFIVQTTDQKGNWYFNPHDRTFQGFRLTHQPSPWMGDFSSFLLTPLSGKVDTSDLFHSQSSYRPEASVFAPHYLKLKQERYQITSELVPTTYGAILKSDYHHQEMASLLLTSQGSFYLKIDTQKREVKGFVSNFSGSEDPEFKMYFCLLFDTDFELQTSGVIEEGEVISGTEFNGVNLKAILRFKRTSKVETKLATSFISLEQAELNLQRFVATEFQALKSEASQTWLNYLNRIEVTDTNQANIATFYGSLYRTFLFPQRFYEIDQANKEVHYDTISQTVKLGKLYTNNGFWDTYKTVYPLYSLIAEKEYEDMLEGFLNSYRNAGFLPKWLSPDERGLMPGTLIDAVIADAAVKGIGQNLMPQFLEAMIKGATVQSVNPNYGRRGTNQYNQLGYVSSEYGESVNHTQDYAYSDFCIAQVARLLGEVELAEEYEKRSYNYRHLFDKSVGFMRAKEVTGAFVSDFEPLNWGRDYTEGSAWQNSFAVYHNVADLVELHGGPHAFLAKLIELCNTYPEFDVFGYGFEIHEMSEMAAVDFGQVAMSNQPSFHLPYLFNYVNQPMYTQLLVKTIKDNLFNAGWDGYPGDEDNGSMSAWYIFSCLGFYPVCPGSGDYAIGIPSFSKVKLHLSNGKELKIKMANGAASHHFVKEIRQGQNVGNLLSITHNQLLTGEELVFEMTLVPPLRSEQLVELPYSLGDMPI